MKYLTKDWYELSQRTDLHFDMKVHNGADTFDEALYTCLYKNKENDFIKLEQEIYAFIHENSDDSPPFDEKKCGEEFRAAHEAAINETVAMLPRELVQQIADLRVFALGYCTQEILTHLKFLSQANKKEVNRILNAYYKTQQAENVSSSIRERFAFHDCEVTEYSVDENNVVMRFDTQGGFTDFNMITFVAPEIIKEEGDIAGSIWLYEELYRIENGYEAHMLFSAEEMHEFIVRCKDIVIEEVRPNTFG